VPGYTKPGFNQVSFPQAEHKEDPKKNTCLNLSLIKRGIPQWQIMTGFSRKETYLQA
jgi:hypothetical protein